MPSFSALMQAVDNPMPDLTGSESPPILVFPSDMRQAGPGKAYPFVSFQLVKKDRSLGTMVHLPMPPGVTISDNMSYSTIDLGIFGDVVAQAVAGGQGKGSTLEAIEGGGKAGLSAMTSKIKSLTAYQAAQVAMHYSPATGALIGSATGGASGAVVAAAAGVGVEASSLGGILDFSSKSLLAPNTNTTFQGSQIRGITFTFKMVARTAADTDLVKSIVQTFRHNMYPDSDLNGVIMSYPVTWNISFNDGDGTNQYIPGWYESYLTAFSSTYNPSTNLLYESGAPIEVDVTMSYQETRALRKSDIVTLLGA